MIHYDRQGQPIGMMEWAKLVEDPADYRRVAENTLDDGHIWVSTVWLGIDYSFGGGPPLIFETMVFIHLTPEQLEERRERWVDFGFDADRFPWEDAECRRYATEVQARAGHREMVESLTLRVETIRDADAPGG